MSIRLHLAFAAPLLLALSACGDEADVDVENDGREASGEVLEGSISDAMLPLDEVRSQAPLAEPEETAAAASAPAAGPAATPAEDSAPAAEPAAPEAPAAAE
jgi:hypothetical protein